MSNWKRTSEWILVIWLNHALFKMSLYNETISYIPDVTLSQSSTLTHSCLVASIYNIKKYSRMVDKNNELKSLHYTSLLMWFHEKIVGSKKGMNKSSTVVTNLIQSYVEHWLKSKFSQTDFSAHYLNKLLQYIPTQNYFEIICGCHYLRPGKRKPIWRKAYLFKCVVLHFLTESIQKFNNSQLTDSVLRYLHMMQS